MPRVSKQQLGVTLLRVVPGLEMAVIQDWLERLRARDAEGFESAIYLTLGRSDLALIQAPAIEEEAGLCATALPGVVCAKELDCYAWEGKHRVDQVLQKSLCALIFARLNPDLWSEPGYLEVEMEQAVAGHLTNYGVPTEAVWCLLGTYGRASNVILVGADEVDDLFRTSRDLIASCCEIAPGERMPFLRETYTVIGVEWPNPKEGLSGLRERYSLRRERGEFFADAELAMEMRCCSADVFTLAEGAKNVWCESLMRDGELDDDDDAPVVSVAFGPADIHLRFALARYETFGALVVDLHEFRHLFAEVLLTTESRVEFPVNERNVPSGVKFGEVDMLEPFLDDRGGEPVGIAIERELAEQIMGIHEEAPAILHSFYAYNHRLRDDGGEAVRDLLFYYAECRETAHQIARMRQRKVPIADELRELYVMLEAGQIGQIQRLDAFPMSRRAGTDLGPYRSGIRRKLWAAQAIPAYVLNDLLHSHWRGFLVGGRLKDAFATRPPVMNMPAEWLPHPESWWVLTHEAMHDYLDRYDALDFDAQPWLTIFELFAEKPTADAERYFRWLATECLCDMLEFLSLGALSWEEHQRVCWTYVLDRLAADPGWTREERCDFVAEHVLRTVCAMRCDPENKGKGADVLLDDFLARIIVQLQLRGRPVARFNDAYEDAYLRRKLLKRCDAFKPISSWLNGRNPFDPAEQDRRIQWRNEQYKSCRDQLSEGTLVPPDVLQYPDLLVWLLRGEAPSDLLPPRMATATVLSLLWFYTARYMNW